MQKTKKMSEREEDPRHPQKDVSEAAVEVIDLENPQFYPTKKSEKTMDYPLPTPYTLTPAPSVCSSRSSSSKSSSISKVRTFSL